MPELPEVEIVRTGLSRLLPGLMVRDVCHDNATSFPNLPADVNAYLIGARVVGVRRRAKVLLIDLSSGWSLVIHLKMTGQLVFVRRTRGELAEGERFAAGHPSYSLIGELPDRSTRATIAFTDGSHLFFNDQRKFGWMRLIESAKVEALKFMQEAGPEPLSKDFDSRMMQERLLRRPKTSIKAALLDQTVIAGIGNIYADESLWGAQIHPSTLVKDLSPTQIKHLHESLIAALKLSIEKGGSTDRNYVDVEGRRGSYLAFANVYRREGQPCPRCGTTIIKLKVASRGTHVCPNCQRI